VNAILDEAFFCHVGFTVDAQPFVVPTVHAREGETLYLHGALASPMLKTLTGGVTVCVTEEEDYALPCWAGVLPLQLTALPPQPDPRLPPGVAPPAAVAAWSRGARR